MIPLKEEQPDYPTPGAQVTIMYRIEKITLMKQISRDGSPGTELYEIMEDCLRIARGDASDGSLRA